MRNMRTASAHSCNLHALEAQDWVVSTPNHVHVTAHEIALRASCHASVGVAIVGCFLRVHAEARRWRCRGHRCAVPV